MSKSVMRIGGIIEGVSRAQTLVVASKATGIAAIIEDITVLCHGHVVIALANTMTSVAVLHDVCVPISIAAIRIIVIFIVRIVATTEETHLGHLSLLREAEMSWTGFEDGDSRVEAES